MSSSTITVCSLQCTCKSLARLLAFPKPCAVPRKRTGGQCRSHAVPWTFYRQRSLSASQPLNPLVDDIRATVLIDTVQHTRHEGEMHVARREVHTYFHAKSESVHASHCNKYLDHALAGLRDRYRRQVARTPCSSVEQRRGPRRRTRNLALRSRSAPAGNTNAVVRGSHASDGPHRRARGARVSVGSGGCSGGGHGPHQHSNPLHS